MSYFWIAFCFAAGGFVAGTIWGRWLQSAAIDWVVAKLKPAK